MKGLKRSNYFKGVVALATFAILMSGSVSLAHASLAETEVEWRQLVGVISPGNTVGTGSGKVTGGGTPWVVSNGSAEVNLTTGDIRFRVDGLVLAGGNSIGTPDGVTSVKGTLVCDTTGVLNSGNSTIVDTPLVTLSPQGNARFSGNLGALPLACTSQPNIAFLVRSGGGAWLAGGVVRITETDDDDDRR